MARILFITRVPITASRFVLPFAKKLAGRGNYIQFACGPGEGIDEMVSSGFPLVVLPMEKKSLALRNLRGIIDLQRIMREGKFEIVHTYSPVAGVIGRIAAHFSRAPIVIHSVIGSLMIRGVPLFQQSFYLISEWLLGSWISLYITLNDRDARDLVRFHLAPAHKVISLRYEFGVDLTKFDPARINGGGVEALRHKLAIPEAMPVIGYVGRLIGAKGILDLFDAYKILRRNGYRTKLLYLGDVLTTDKDQHSVGVLKKRVCEEHLQEDVIFTGFQKNVPLYLALMDIVVLPSHQEGFPRIPVEAGAMGKPSVITATGGSDIAVEDGKTGFVVPVKDVSRLAQAIENLVRNPRLVRSMGAASLARVRQLFDQEKILEQQIDCYYRAIQSAGSSAHIAI